MAGPRLALSHRNEPPEESLRPSFGFIEAGLVTPQFRRDELRENWVLVAPGRRQRPTLFQHSTQIAHADDPFAEGSEAHTPPEVFAIRESGTLPDTPGWRVRVFPNKFPAVQGPERVAIESGPDTPLPAIGRHEVVVDCPHSELHFARLPSMQIRDVFVSYRQRVRQLVAGDGWATVTVFKNEGPAAGASVGHCHSQILALPLIPEAVSRELAVCERSLRDHRKEFFAGWLSWHDTAGLVIDRNADFVVVAPYASRFPYEMWLVPVRPLFDFRLAEDGELLSLAVVLKGVLLALEDVANQPDWNFVLQLPPFPPSAETGYRWHLRILPRMTGVAGFEWGTGVFINPVPPEEAAEHLRSALNGHLAPEIEVPRT